MASSADYFAGQTSETDSFGIGAGGGSIIIGDAGFLEVPLAGEADVEIDIIAEQLMPSSFHLCIICHLSLPFPLNLP